MLLPDSACRRYHFEAEKKCCREANFRVIGSDQPEEGGSHALTYILKDTGHLYHLGGQGGRETVGPGARRLDLTNSKCKDLLSQAAGSWDLEKCSWVGKMQTDPIDVWKQLRLHAAGRYAGCFIRLGSRPANI